MMCQACNDGEHGKCEDVVRYDRYVAWLRSHPFGVDAVIGQAQMVVIKANRPYDSCPCQHKGPDMKVLNERVDALHGPGAAAAIDEAYKNGTLFSQ